MKVVILCGGQGTRIRDANEHLPKPMLPIGGKPIVWHIMKTYSAFGHTDFVLCLGYRGWSIKEFFLNYRAMMSDVTVSLGDDHVELHRRPEEASWRVTLADTGENTWTGARIAAVRRYVEGDEPFFATYGDGVADIDLDQLLSYHRQRGRVATVTAVRPPGRFGEMKIANGHVNEFNEKPQVSEGFINGGFFVFDARRIWKYLEGGPLLALEERPLRSLANDGELAAFEHTGFWMPMDTSREYQLLNDLWREEKAAWKVW
ncbi:MAG: glucose-1-phosphate cytidylyltransferase [Polyangiaceae bacterium]